MSRPGRSKAGQEVWQRERREVSRSWGQARKRDECDQQLGRDQTGGSSRRAIQEEPAREWWGAERVAGWSGLLLPKDVRAPWPGWRLDGRKDARCTPYSQGSVACAYERGGLNSAAASWMDGRTNVQRTGWCSTACVGDGRAAEVALSLVLVRYRRASGQTRGRHGRTRQRVARRSDTSWNIERPSPVQTRRREGRYEVPVRRGEFAGARGAAGERTNDEVDPAKCPSPVASAG